MGEKNDWQCAKCGGGQIHHDATVVWNQQRQDWDVTMVHDGMQCATCPDGGQPYYHKAHAILAAQQPSLAGAMQGGV